MPMRSIDLDERHAADLQDCRGRLRVGSRSFHAAAFLLPRSFREPASALYAFCRIADDAIDDDPQPARALERLHARLDAIYDDRPSDCSADRALAGVVRRFGIPKALFIALFEGFAWDARGRRYANIGELLDYAARVAGAVGAMMALLMGVRDRDMLARACDLGAAMQLSNIARDVGEDARAGRVYLPLDWLQEGGVDPDELTAEPRYTSALGGVVQRLLHEADLLYRRADSGIARLPSRCRPAMYAARLLYAEIGHEVARQGCDSVSRRAVVSPRRKLAVLSALRRLRSLPTPALAEPALASTRFLVEASATSVIEFVPDPLEARGNRLVWMLDMIDELNRRDRETGSDVVLDDSVAFAQDAHAR